LFFNQYVYYDYGNDDDDDEYGAFLNRMLELRLMIRELMLNPTPILEQLNIVRKLKVLNYALDEWNDEYARREQQQQKHKKDNHHTDK
jgi:hypothetical protein